ncbi:MAG: hypothetical protein J4G06_05885 [Caldilineaceae bacterium]|nr:hypothetical protein [Caldilineaceae bacterium]
MNGDYDHDQTYGMAESALEALKILDNMDAMCLAEFDGDNLEGRTSLNGLAQAADTENAKTRKGITDPAK